MQIESLHIHDYVHFVVTGRQPASGPVLVVASEVRALPKSCSESNPAAISA